MTIINEIIDSYRAAKAISKAKRLKLQTGRKHYVLKIKKKYYAFNKNQIATLRRKGYLHNGLGSLELSKTAYFITD